MHRELTLKNLSCSLILQPPVRLLTPVSCPEGFGEKQQFWRTPSRPLQKKQWTHPVHMTCSGSWDAQDLSCNAVAQDFQPIPGPWNLQCWSPFVELNHSQQPLRESKPGCKPQETADISAINYALYRSIFYYTQLYHIQLNSDKNSTELMNLAAWII